MCRKSSRLRLFSALIIFTCFLALIAEPVIAETGTIKLIFAHSNSSMHDQHTKVFVPWAKQIEALSNGEIKIELRPESMKDSEVLPLLKLGAIDIGWNVRAFNAGDFPLSSVFELPFMIKNGEQGSLAFWKAIEKSPVLANEYAKIKLLAVSVNTPSAFNSSKKPIRSLNDLKGIAMYFPNRIAGNAMEIFGVAKSKITNIGINDFAPGMSLGLFDAIPLPAEALPLFKLDSIVKYYTDVAFSSYTFWMAMNLKKYNALPKRVQKILDDTTGEVLSRKMGLVFDRSSAGVLDFLIRKKGIEHIVLPEVEMQKMRKMVQKTSQESWVKDMKAKDLPGKQVMDVVRVLPPVLTVPSHGDDTVYLFSR